MTIGEKIFKYRKQARLSQEELADKMNVTRQSISLWETDQTTPSLDNLIMLAEIFSISMDELCGTQSTKDIAPDRTNASENSDCLVCVQTKYTVDLINGINKLAAKKFYILIIIAEILAIFLTIRIIVSDIDKAVLAIPIFLIVILVASSIRFSLTLKKRKDNFFKLRPNCIANVKLFQDYFELEITSDKSDSKSTIPYSDIKKVKNDERFIYIYYGDSIVPIEKNLPNINYDLILKLLNVSDENKPQSGKINNLLLAMFIFSLLSIIFALIVTAISVQLSPLPDYPYAFSEYMWVFLIFIILPLTSAILGIVFYSKKYECKKNIIGGVIMCAVLAIYGSFAFVYKDNYIHDFGYVSELEQTVLIDLPDSGYVSLAKNVDSTTKCVAMIKFNDANDIFNVVSSDERFSSESVSIPLNLIDTSYVLITSNYHYFVLLDVTPDTDDKGQSEEHRYIYLAYNKDKNILFALDFVK